MLVEPISKTLSNKDASPEQESNSSPKENTQVTASFSNFVGQTDILPYRILIKENIKSFNLIPNEENPTKETELENSLKAKY